MAYKDNLGAALAQIDALTIKKIEPASLNRRGAEVGVGWSLESYYFWKKMNEDKLIDVEWRDM